jgi:hypothetical protein
LKRPLSYLSFYLNIITTGFDPFYFKLTNLFVHFVNSFLVLLISRLIFGRFIKEENKKKLALLVFAIFLLHPLALTSVLYIVQRMTSLSAFFTLLGIYGYLYGRLRIANGQHCLLFIGFSTISCSLFAVFSKENGALLPYYCLLIEVVILQFQNLSPFSTRLFKIIFATMILVPLCYALLRLGTHPTLLQSWFTGRPFTLSERLMTETRVMWFYIRLIFVPDINLMGLYHDDIQISTGFLSPWTTLTSTIGLLILFISSLILRSKTPILSFGILFFFIGHSIESSIIPLEIAHEHRNYLPMLGLIIVAVYYLDQLFSKTTQPNIKKMLVCIILLVIATSTSLRANIWRNQVDQTLSSVNKHPRSPRANHEAGRILLKLAAQQGVNKEASYAMALSHLNRAYQLNPDDPTELLSLIHATYLARQKPSHEQLAKLLELLTGQPLPANLYSEVNAITECIIASICLLTDDQISEIYNRILYNPHTRSSNKASILNIAAYYYAEQKEFNTSLRYLYLAADIYDNFNQRALLCGTLTKSKLLGDAEKCMNKLKSRDDAFFYNTKVDKLQKQLMKAKLELKHSSIK